MERRRKLYKICPKCKETKEFSQFPKSKKEKYGLNPYCRECVHLYYEKNKKRIQQVHKLYTEKNPLKIKQLHTLYCKVHKEDLIEKGKLYRKSHKKHRKLYNREYDKVRYKNNINYKILRNLKTRFWWALKQSSTKKIDRTVNLLGCSIIELKIHLEKQFTSGMTWDNHKMFGWHIDHIKPCSLFDLTDPEQQKECFHYTNLQPLWWQDNLKKFNHFN